MRPRIPLAYAGLLVTALMAVIGFAAFSPTSFSVTEAPVASTVPDDAPEATARVASAVLALRFADPGSQVATTQSTTTTVVPRPTTTTIAPSTTAAPIESDEPVATTEAAQATTTTPAPATRTAPTTTKPRDTTAPPIRVTSHDDGDTVTSSVVTFKGTSEAGAKVASGPYAATMSDNGDWSLALIVVDGANGAKFTATDKAGNSATTHIVVSYNPSTTTTTKASATTTTTKASATTTTSGSTPTTTTATTTTQAPSSKWSPNWPADSGGIRDVENWRSTVAQYWPASRVDCALGIIQRESKGDPRAYNSSSSAEGLMQHLSKYWHDRAKGAGFIDSNGLVATPYNGAANIAAGAYLASYFDSATGDWWNPWKSGNGSFTAFYGSCQSSDPS